MIYEFHPLANIFPLIEGKAFDDLVEDIRKNGVREPIWVYQHQILDGRNRYRAAKQLGQEVEFRTYDGEDPVSFVISLNLHRRHLNESQRAAVAAKLANITAGQFAGNQHVPSANLQTPQVSQAQAADMLNVSTRTVAAAAKVIHNGDESLIRAVERGEATVSAAAAVADLPKQEQKQVVDAGAEAIRAIAKAKRPAGKPKTGAKAEAMREELKEASQRGSSIICTSGRLLLSAIQSSEGFTEEERDLLGQIASAISNL